VYDYWGYFLPIQRGMPKNCSADFVQVAEHVDDVIARGNRTEIVALQAMFGLEDVEHPSDFARYRVLPSLLGMSCPLTCERSIFPSVLGQWQSILPYTGYSPFFQMCDTMEGARPVNTTDPVPSFSSTRGTSVPADGIGLEKALSNLALWFKYESLPGSE
jgi:hypothetical protein